MRLEHLLIFPLIALPLLAACQDPPEADAGQRVSHTDFTYTPILRGEFEANKLERAWGPNLTEERSIAAHSSKRRTDEVFISLHRLSDSRKDFQMLWAISVKPVATTQRPKPYSVSYECESDRDPSPKGVKYVGFTEFACSDGPFRPTFILAVKPGGQTVTETHHESFECYYPGLDDTGNCALNFRPE